MDSGPAKRQTANSLIGYGNELLAAGETNDALRLYEAAMVLCPHSPAPYKLRGDCLLKLADHAGALEAYDRALALRPHYVTALYNRAVVKKAMGHLVEALADLDEVLAIDATSVHACSLRGDIQVEFGRLEEAEADYARALAMDPDSPVAAYRKGKAALLRQRGQNDRQAIFGYIYEAGVWGRSDDPTDRYFSGSGTRVAAYSDRYVQALRSFLGSISPPPNVVDIGCGDFFIGARVRGCCGEYVACDVVDGLIAYNKQKYADLNVDFRVLDAVDDDLPPGDVVVIREVLQHLSNDNIKSIISKIYGKYRYAVITECLPNSENFIPNLDKVTGDKIRQNVNGSGVVLTLPPFNLKVKEERVICLSEAGLTKLVTTLYSF